MAAGVLLALAFPAWGLFPLAWVAPALLFWRAAPMRPLAAGHQFFAAGWVFHTLELQWLMANIFWAGGWAVLGWQFLCVILALFWAIVGAAWAWVRPRSPRLGGAVLLALFWAVMEFGITRCFTGFGWTVIAHSQGPNLALLQLAAVGGALLVGFVIVLVNTLLALAVREQPQRGARLVAAAGVAVWAHLAGTSLLAEPSYAEKPLKAGVVQTGFAQEMKFHGGYEELMVERAAHYTRRLAADAAPDLVVWPEATIMDSFDRPPFADTLARLARETGTAIFAGAVRDADGKSFNSSVLVLPDGTFAAHYDKVHLVPFGEYMPFDRFLPFLRKVVPADVDRGESQAVIPFAGRTLGPLICFEVLHAYLGENLREMGADCLVVVTNLSWFGRSNALAQELDIARLRAIESRLPLVHAANSGISGVFDPYGRFTGMHDAYPPAMTAYWPMVRAFPLAEAAPRPLPWGPAAAPWVFTAFAALVLAAAAVPRRGPA
jgi:apolipoprotein N-acyltransferase